MTLDYLASNTECLEQLAAVALECLTNLECCGSKVHTGGASQFHCDALDLLCLRVVLGESCAGFNRCADLIVSEGKFLPSKDLRFDCFGDLSRSKATRLQGCSELCRSGFVCGCGLDCRDGECADACRYTGNAQCYFAEVCADLARCIAKGAERLVDGLDVFRRGITSANRCIDCDISHCLLLPCAQVGHIWRDAEDRCICPESIGSC